MVRHGDALGVAPAARIAPTAPARTAAAAAEPAPAAPTVSFVCLFASTAAAPTAAAFALGSRDGFQRPRGRHWPRRGAPHDAGEKTRGARPSFASPVSVAEDARGEVPGTLAEGPRTPRDDSRDLRNEKARLHVEEIRDLVPFFRPRRGSRAIPTRAARRSPLEPREAPPRRRDIERHRGSPRVDPTKHARG